ncbi:hypothetical protein DVH05_001400 [Phytophthora capsici]|nr:hypothetical protein DVH05_001400 [Phytophthora capsici]
MGMGRRRLLRAKFCVGHHRNSMTGSKKRGIYVLREREQRLWRPLTPSLMLFTRDAYNAGTDGPAMPACARRTHLSTHTR